MNTIKTKMGVASVIRNVLKCEIKEVSFDDIKLGQFFELEGEDDIYVKIDEMFGFSLKGEWKSLTHIVVKPLHILLEYDYHLIDEDGKEFVPHGRD